MTDPRHCHHCGTALPAGAAAEDLCPRCVLELALEVGDSSLAEPGATPPAPPPAESTPERIGPYKLLERLGEGGMGVVWLAEQQEPIRRRVALKVIKLGMDSREVIARFESERQALALMNHPGTAKVFDAGTTERGAPFFVMEQVSGLPITDYCDRNRLGFRDRLELFIQVCKAVQHAHQKGVIHRDIKPSNVLVAVVDGKPQPKVIDFGVAKAISQRLTEKTLFTRQGRLVGTPEYMSPEQAEATAAEVDTTTDVYSLGVLLYELLTGALPFHANRLREAGYAEMQRIICEEEPEKPSTKVSGLGALAKELAARRRVPESDFPRELRGDLDWMTLKALEKDRTRRYPSATEFAADVQRHLEDEPVSASPPSRLYRFEKLVRRNKGPVIAVLAVLATLVAGLAVSTVLYLRAESARLRAEAEAKRNHLEATALQAAIGDDVDDYLKWSGEALDMHRTVLGSNNPRLAGFIARNLVLIGLITLFEEIPDDVKTTIEQLEREALDLVDKALATEDQTILETLDLLAEHFEEENEAQAARLYRQALRLRRQTLPPDDAVLILNLEKLAGILESRAAPRLAKGNPVAAEKLYREALKLRREAHPSGSHRSAVVQSHLGWCLSALQRYDEAEPLLIQSYRFVEAELGGTSATRQMLLSRIIALYEAWNKPARAEEYRQMLPPRAAESVRELAPLQLKHGGSGGFSARVGDRSVWLFSGNKQEFAEGLVSKRSHRWTWGSNSWAWTDDTNARDGLAPFQVQVDILGDPAELLRLSDEEAAYNERHRDEDCVEDCGSHYAIRPGPLVVDPASGQALIFYTKEFTLNRGPFEYQTLGTSLAVWRHSEGSPDRPKFRAAADHPRLLFPAEEPAWGSGALLVGRQLYAYACEPEGLECPCLVARVAWADALERTAWSFYTGAGTWSADWRDARAVLEAAHPKLSVHWNQYLGKYVAVHSTIMDTSISIRTADQPEGPWSDVEILIEGMAPDPESSWHSSALAHPEFSREGGRVEYLTYHRPTGFLSGETRLVEIQFE